MPRALFCACVYVTERHSPNCAFLNGANICECVCLHACVREHSRTRASDWRGCRGWNPGNNGGEEGGATASPKIEKSTGADWPPRPTRKIRRAGLGPTRGNCGGRAVCPCPSPKIVEVGTGLGPRLKNRKREGLGPTQGNREGGGVPVMTVRELIVLKQHPIQHLQEEDQQPLVSLCKNWMKDTTNNKDITCPLVQ